MAQRQRAWLQIRRLGVRISLASFFIHLLAHPSTFHHPQTDRRSNWSLLKSCRWPKFVQASGRWHHHCWAGLAFMVGGVLIFGTQHEACSLVDSCLYKWPWHNKTNVRILTLAPHCQIRSKPIVVPMLFWKKKLLWDGTLLHLFLSIKDLQLDMPAEKKHFYISCHPSHPHSNAHVDELRWTHMYCAPKKNKKNLQLRSKKAQEPAKGTKPAQFKKWKRLVE